MEKLSCKSGRWAALLLILLAAAFLRLYRLDQVPPGWRDDELINSLVISQHVLDGEWSLFYADASGHEALYHILNAGFLQVFGPGVPGIRWLSVLLGVLSIALTIQLGRRLYGFWVGLIAGIGLSASFWSLMYSRVGLRHVSLLPFMLGAWLALWAGIKSDDDCRNRYGISCRYRYFILTGLFLGINFYTYFAARGLPLVLVALLVYWLVFDRASLKKHWKGIALALVVAGLIYIPLWVTLNHLPEMTGRIEELAVPLVEARDGNLEPLIQHVLSTLNMFNATGDDEWLYNIPYRPLFNFIGALLFFIGILFCLYWSLSQKKKVWNSESAFVLIWLLAGMAPAFISVPAASLGHTIIAQPCTYLIPAIGLAGAAKYTKKYRWPIWVISGIALIFLASNSVRDLTDYFSVWPQRGMVRFLYRGDIHDVTGYLNQQPAMINLAFTGSLAGPWDRQAMLADMERPVVDRWFDPSRSILFPSAGGYLVMTDYPKLAQELEPFFNGAVDPLVETKNYSIYRTRVPALGNNIIGDDVYVTFQNGLVLKKVSLASGGLLSQWVADGIPSNLPPFRLISNPPPPGVDIRPRLAVFVHFLDRNNLIVSIDDGFWVDPYTLQPGDTWLQYNPIVDRDQTEVVEIGLYDPVTGERILTDDGRDRLLISLKTR
ncbi:MAG: glycosyltransferase family 39 protein [Anaerolineales bacterium]|nr:glycosyltransferase family 39 protein [Anaerolineales bacterium]